ALVGFGSVEYSNEELIAEMGASFLNALAGIKDANFKNSLAYLKGWLKPLKDDPKMLIYAAQKAHQAANYVLGIESEGEELSLSNFPLDISAIFVFFHIIEIFPKAKCL